MKQMTLVETKLDADFIVSIQGSLRRYTDATHVLIYSNHAMDSAGLGHQCALLCGPSNTLRTIEEAQANSGKFPFANAPNGDTGWKYILDGWIPRSEFE